MAKTIFYAWQSDQPKTITREFIRAAIEAAIARLKTDAALQEADDLEIDHDTKDVSGSPPIAETICKKIDACAVFIADLTFVGEYINKAGTKKQSVNGNVLVELGYARGKLGVNYIVTVQNSHFGKPDDLPFDLKHLRHPIQFDVSEGMSDANKAKQQAMLTDRLETAFRDVLKNVIASEVAEMARLKADQTAELERVRSQSITQIESEWNDLLDSGRKGHRGMKPGSRIIGITGIFPLTKPSPSLNVDEIYKKYVINLKPIGAGGWDHGIYPHSVATYDGEKTTMMEVTDAGRVFTIHYDVMEPDKTQPKLYLQEYEFEWIRSVGRSVSLLRKLGVLGSLHVHCALLNVKGFLILPNNYRPARHSVRAVEVRDIDLEPAELEPDVDGSSEVVVAAALRDSFRIAWREGGITSDPCFNTDGEYVIK